MAKAILGRYTKKDTDFAAAIEGWVKRARANIDKLAATAGISRSTYYAHLRNPEKITIRELRAYIRMLDIPEGDIIAALYPDKEGGNVK